MRKTAAVAESGRSQSRGITRRGLVGSAAAGTAGLALGGLPGVASAAGRSVDCIVVGAGLAGLSAATELKRAGRSFVVLEARDRVGGRTLNHHLGHGRVVEIGGQWVGPTQNYVLREINRQGLKTFKTFADGDNVYYRNGTRQTYTGTIPPANVASLIELQTIITEMDNMAATIDPAKPWKAASAQDWDGQTFETWKQGHGLAPETRDLVDLAIESVFAAEPRDLSLLHVLFYIRAAGSFENLINTGGGAQDSRVVGGSQEISIRMARRLGGSVVLGAPVHRIEHHNRSVEIRTAKGTFTARRVIVAVPPTLAGRIRYSPDLPAKRDQLMQRVPMGTVMKCLAIYDKPFWRDDGLSGMATSTNGPIKLTFDNSPPGGKPGILLGFIEGQEARDLLGAPRAKRRKKVLDAMARFFGERVHHTVDYAEKSWAEDPWTRGCYVGYYPPGVLTGYRNAINAPTGVIHWAGTETASEWNGYMDGALQSGERAAGEVLSKL